MVCRPESGTGSAWLPSNEWGSTQMREERLRISEYDKQVVVRASGSLGKDAADQVRAVMLSRLSKGDTRLVLDLEAVSYINSDGLRMLQDVLRQAETHEASLALAKPNDSVLRTLTLTRLDRQLPVFDSVEAALNGKGS